MTTKTTVPRLSRRGMLLGAGATVAAGATAWAMVPAAAEDASGGGRFDLTVKSPRYFRGRTVKDKTVMQSFDFDYGHKRVYVVQAKGTGGPGDLTLTKLDLSGKRISHMYLNGFGHGVNIGVEPVGSHAYIWVEADPDAETGYGRAITRFKYRGGKSLTFGSSDLPVYRPVSGARFITPKVDMLNKRIAVGYVHSGAYHYQVYDLEAFKNKDFTPVASLKRVGVGNETFQGWTLWGDYIYQMTGNPYTDEDGDNPPSKRGNCYLSCIDMNSGELVQRNRTQTAYSLDFREPQGMAVMPTSPPRLFMGFASGKSGDRKVNLYYKEQ